jgi:maltoporin
LKKISMLLVMFMVLIITIPIMAATKTDGNQVTFTFKAPDANLVYLSGTFNGWSPTGEKMTKGEDGVWSVTIKLKPNTYQYKFVVDGKWTPDPDAASTVDDGYGGKNAILIVKATGVADDARLDKMEQEIAALKESQGGFQFNGYARSGFFVDDDGKQVTSKNGVNNAWAQYRLGNENGTFIENTLSKKWLMDDGSWAKVTFLWCHQDDATKNVWENDDAILRQSFAELGNLPNLSGLTFWAGRRYYRREDIHLTDFWWRDFSGIGAGVQGFKLGDSTLDAAVMFHGDGTYAIRQLILTLTGFKVGPGSFELDLAPTFQDKDSADKSGYGTALAAKYGLGSFFGLNGSSFVGLYYGNSIASNPNWYGPQTTISSVDDKTLLRLVASGVWQITDNFEIQPLLLYQKQEQDDWNQTWKSIGFRPVYHLNKNFALQFEVGHDTTDDSGTGDASGTKYTIAPTITLDKGFYTRPQVRVFATRFVPDSGDATNKYGVQMEAWW